MSVPSHIKEHSILGVGNHAGMYVSENAVSQVMSTDAAVINAFATKMPDAGMSSSLVNNEITVIGGGICAIAVQLSFSSGTGNVIYNFELYVNGVASGIKFERKVVTSGDVGSGSLTGVIALVPGDVVDLRCYVDSGTPNITVKHGQIQVVRLQ